MKIKKQLVFDGDRWFYKRLTELEHELLVEEYRLKEIEAVKEELNEY